MMVVKWCQANSVLPTRNFREGVFELADEVSGDAMERIKVKQRGCPMCPMMCGNVVETHEGLESELDYENVAMLGPNIGLGDLKKVAALNRFADEAGIDTISLGSAIAFAIEASEKGLIGEKLEWGDFDAAMQLARKIVERDEFGDTLAEGVANAAKRVGGDAEKFAMHVKGLEISAYDCHAAPGMALSFGTSPIGAHHKDAWVIAWEVSFGRDSYAKEKVEKVIELQRIRGGVFESLVSCRFPWIEIGLELDWYPKLLEAATGVKVSLEHLFEVGDRVYALIRAYWVRELGGWSRELDTPPARWFEEPLTEGPLKGAKLSRKGYDDMLSMYYEARGWDERGIPRESTLESLELGYVADELSSVVKLSP
jgi:aldehyde:ferredoxin oxidoreductase